MTPHVRDFLKKTLTSRKFWAAVTASVPFAMAGDFENFAMVWMAYAGIQGAVDASEGVGSKKAGDTLPYNVGEEDKDVIPKGVPSETKTEDGDGEG